MNVLLAVASKHGSTREIASAIAEELQNSGLSVDLQEVRDIDTLNGYDAIILGSAIYAGQWLPEARDFATAVRTELVHFPLWLFSSGPLGAENPQPQDDPAKLAESLGDIPVLDHRVFVGKLDPTKLGLGERLIAKAVHAPAGDFRNWDEIRAWAREIARELHVLSAPVGK